jgi:hypothetical protein
MWQSYAVKRAGDVTAVYDGILAAHNFCPFPTSATSVCKRQLSGHAATLAMNA